VVIASVHVGRRSLARVELLRFENGTLGAQLLRETADRRSIFFTVPGHVATLREWSDALLEVARFVESLDGNGNAGENGASQ